MRLFSRRRLLGSFAGSLLLHGLLVVASRRSEATDPPPPETPAVSFEPMAPVADGRTRVAIVGPAPSGRGRALAGRNPARAGSPRHAPRPEAARGQASGPGEAAGAPTAIEPAAPAATREIEPEALAPPSADDALPVPATSPGTMVSMSEPAAPAAPTVDANRAFDELARAQRLRLANGDGGGLTGSGPGGDGVGLGLATELSGRHVATSHVVTPPVVTKERPIECKLPATLRLIAVVRVLVTRNGSAAAPRLLRSSGHASFDRCALSYVLAMRFSPGLDGQARPLDVWMNVQVTPTAAGTSRDPP